MFFFLKIDLRPCETGVRVSCFDLENFFLSVGLWHFSSLVGDMCHSIVNGGNHVQQVVLFLICLNFLGVGCCSVATSKVVLISILAH